MYGPTPPCASINIAPSFVFEHDGGVNIELFVSVISLGSIIFTDPTNTIGQSLASLTFKSNVEANKESGVSSLNVCPVELVQT